MQAQYGRATVSRVIDLDPFALPLEFLFPNATLEALAPARDMLAGISCRLGQCARFCSPCRAT